MDGSQNRSDGMTRHLWNNRTVRLLISLFLFCAMMLSALPLTAYAEETAASPDAIEAAESAPAKAPQRAIAAGGVGSYGGPNNATGYKTASKFGGLSGGSSSSGKTGDWYLDPDGTLYLKGDFCAQGVSVNNRGTVWPWLNTNNCNPETDIKRVVIDGSVQPANGVANNGDCSMAYMFYACRAIESIDLTGLRMINETNGTNRGRVINLAETFRANNALTSINFGTDFDVSQVGNMYRTFNNCGALTSLDLSSWKGSTANVTDMSYMFGFDSAESSLGEIKFPDGWDTKNVGNMSYMFYGCGIGNLALDMTNWTFKSGVNVNNMFQKCNMASVDLSGKNLSFVNHSTFGTGGVGSNGATIGSLNLSGTTFVTLADKFRGVNVGTLNMENAVISGSMMQTFDGANIGTLNMKGCDFTNVTVSLAFQNATIGTADLSGTKFGTSMSGMFQNAKKIDTLNLKNANTSNVSNMNSLFQNGKFDYINFNVTQIGTGSGSLTAPSRSNMFAGAAFKKITFPDKYANVPGNMNFLSSSGIGSATNAGQPWAKIDENGEVIEGYTYDAIWRSGRNNMVALTGGNGNTLAGTWIMQEPITIQVVKVNEKGNSLTGSTFSVTGGYKNSAKSDSDQETNLTFSPGTAGAEVNVRISGEYELTETVTPQGYMNHNTDAKIRFRVNTGGELELVGSPVGVTVSGKTLIVYNYPENSFAVTKHWDDTENDTRPDTITLRLYDTNDILIDAETVETIAFSEGDEQTVFFSDDTSGEPLVLPHYDNSGKAIKYRVEEEPVENYVTKINDSDPEKITIQNISTSKLKDLTVKVRWKEEDNAAGAARPGTVNVTLKQGKLDPSTGEYVYTEYSNENITNGVLTLTGGGYNASESYGEWTKTVTGVPIYDENGNEYRYDIEQNTVAEYLTPLKDPEEPISLTDDDTFIIVNNHRAVITWLRPGAASPFDPSGRLLYQQQTDPDGMDNVDTLTEGQDKLYDYVKSNNNSNDAGYFIPAKDAYWTEKNPGENTGTADILISYREAPKNVFFLSSLCDAHNLDAAKLAQELAVGATLSDVDYIAEGVNYLGTTYNYGGTTYSVSNKDFNSAGPFSGTVEQGKSGPTLTFATGAHANVLAFAGDIVTKLSGLSNEEKPTQIILSFDWGAWTTCSATLENDDWTKDMQLMRQAASLLQEYYDQGKVIWLASDDTVSGGRLKTFPEMGGYFGGNGALRAKYTNYLYPDSVDDFYDDPVAYKALVDGNYNQGTLENDYRNGAKVTITLPDGSTKQVKPCTTYEFVSPTTYTFTGNGTSMTNKNDKAETIDFFTLSKRIPFYQFALLNPSMFLECTTDTSVTRVPGIDEWLTSYRNGKQYRDTVPAAGYGSVASVGQTLRDNFQGYDTITITDTLVDGLSIDTNDLGNAVEVYYYTGDEAKRTNGSWQKLSGNYTVSCENGKDVTAVIRAKAANILGKRVMLVLHTDCDKIVFADINNQPRETNVGNAQVVTTASQVLDDNGQPYVSNEVSIASPRLRKVLPRAQVTATKTWVDQFGDAWKRPDVVMHLRAKYIDPDTNQAVDSMTNDDILPGILITNGRNQTVIWGAYTEYEGFSVAQYNAKGEGKTLADGKVIVAEGENGLSTKYLDPETDKTYEIEYEIWESAPDGSDVPGYVLESELDKAETYNDGTDFEYKVVAYKRTANVARTLSVKKVVKNDFAGLHDSFDFTITLTPPEDVDERTITITGGTDVTINGAPGRDFSFSNSVGGESGDTGSSEVVISCKLSHNETLNIFPLPKGTGYSVSETLNDRYSTTVTHETEDDEKNKTKETAAYESGVVSGHLEKLAGVTFTNTLISQSELPETGSDEMLRIGLAALAALAGMLLALLMKRRNDRRKGRQVMRS